MGLWASLIPVCCPRQSLVLSRVCDLDRLVSKFSSHTVRLAHIRLRDTQITLGGVLGGQCEERRGATELDRGSLPGRHSMTSNKQ